MTPMAAILDLRQRLARLAGATRGLLPSIRLRLREQIKGILVRLDLIAASAGSRSFKSQAWAALYEIAQEVAQLELREAHRPATAGAIRRSLAARPGSQKGVAARQAKAPLDKAAVRLYFRQQLATKPKLEARRATCTWARQQYGGYTDRYINLVIQGITAGK